MDQIGLLEEAENCRRKALAYLGLQEAVFLIRVAKAFEQLDAERRGPRLWRAAAQFAIPRRSALIRCGDCGEKAARAKRGVSVDGG